jgi:pimeloyl-ACP methyl ester carboxylesterase
MAQDQVEVMHHLGYETFFVASHDRGARTAHRMCLDHPQAVRKICFMEILPTLRMYRDTSKEFATTYMWVLCELRRNNEVQKNRSVPENIHSCLRHLQIFLSSYPTRH